MESICLISDVLVLSFKIIKDWICHEAVSIFLKTEREWEETETKENRAEKIKDCSSLPTSLYEGQKTKGLLLNAGQTMVKDTNPTPLGL